MLLITCPYCGSRPEIEFRNMGEAHIARPDPATATDADMANFLYLRSNPKGLIAERWRHVHGCARFFNAVRHTVTDKFVMTYKVGEPKPDLEALAAAQTEAAR
ncbi:sarcosine oxidase subunit delta [Methyloraptor flagellatus]|jgi:sarcosine oxidase subunit delta|uniref:Sarcosine oxidase subunit delta n=1 Tax=Methyloraptor flagellatus TaxID=3162530 RepID=A0AAU7XEN4_9HYPH